MCIRDSPNNVIRISPEKNKVIVQCKSKDTGAKTRKVCSNGCIGWKKCEKTCKFDAVHVVDNVAMIDPEKCKNCGTVSYTHLADGDLGYERRPAP